MRRREHQVEHRETCQLLVTKTRMMFVIGRMKMTAKRVLLRGLMKINSNKRTKKMTKSPHLQSKRTETLKLSTLESSTMVLVSSDLIS
jgi:hypothetical protein